MAGAMAQSGELDIPQIRNLLKREIRLLDAAIHALSGQIGSSDFIDKEVTAVVIMMSQSLGVSINSIIRLTEDKDMAIRDAYCISRSSSELAVNICYIAAEGREAARRAVRHAMQKSYRDLDRAGIVGGVRIEMRAINRPAVDSVTGLAEALHEFTDRKGREITKWTPLSLSERIAVVSQMHAQAGMSLSAATMLVYRHASELLHGTYFSVVYFWSASGAPARTREDFHSRWMEHFTAVFASAFFAASAVVELLGDLLQESELCGAQQKLTSELQEHIEVASRGAASPTA